MLKEKINKFRNLCREERLRPRALYDTLGNYVYTSIQPTPAIIRSLFKDDKLTFKERSDKRKRVQEGV